MVDAINKEIEDAKLVFATRRPMSREDKAFVKEAVHEIERNIHMNNEHVNLLGLKIMDQIDDQQRYFTTLLNGIEASRKERIDFYKKWLTDMERSLERIEGLPATVN